MQRGQQKNILLPPAIHADLDEFETLSPVATELRNGRVTDAGTWVRRPGLSDAESPIIASGNDVQVTALIPDGPGFALLGNGNLYQVRPFMARVGPGRMTGGARATWARYRNWVVVCDGGAPHRIDIDALVFRPLAGAPPSARLVAALDTYLIMAGHAGATFQWSGVNSPETWPEENFNAVTEDGETIQGLKVVRREVYFFKDRSIEVWLNVGGDSAFARRAKIAKGTPSGPSVVYANDQLYFLGDDQDFYVLEGTTPRILPRKQPRQVRRLVEQLNDPSEVYGFDFRHEGVVRWFAPSQAMIFVYDYVHDLFSLDSMWVSGQHTMLPIASQMELDGVTYCGSSLPDGKIRTWSEDHSGDLGNPIRMQRRFTVPLIGDGTVARCNRLRLRLKRGEYTPAGVAHPKLHVAWAFDRSSIWQTDELDLGPVGDREPYVDIQRLGFGRELTIELTETEAAPLHATHAFLTVEPLGR